MLIASVGLSGSEGELIRYISPCNSKLPSPSPFPQLRPPKREDSRVLITNIQVSGSVFYTWPASNTPSGWEGKCGNLPTKKDP